MPIDRPKILTAIVIPTGGWTLTINYSTVANGQFGDPVTATMAAGTYFLSWDGRSDDFLWELANKVNVALDAAALADWVGRSEGMCLWLDSDHKVNLAFVGSWFTDFGAAHSDVQIDWTATDGASIGGVLGYDTSATLDLTGNSPPETAIADWQHAYGWYADDDGMLESLGIEPRDSPSFMQSFAPSGHSRAQYIGSRLENELHLNFIPRLKTWSREVSYTSAAVYPYARNVPLECWWRAVRDGTRFRVYRSNTIDYTKANESFAPTADTATTITGGAESFNIDPDQWAGKLLITPAYETDSDSADIPMRHYVDAHTATVLTVNQQAEPQHDVGNSESDVCYLFEQPYETYVVDLRAMGGFNPTELPDIDKFELRVPLVRYES
jgi:hypothetical protein